MTKEERKMLEDSGLIYPETTEKDDDTPMVPKHWAEMMMMHHSKDIRAVVRGFIIAFALMVIMAWIFVSGYTSRTKDWLNTYANLRENTAVTEVEHGIQQQPDP